MREDNRQEEGAIVLIMGTGSAGKSTLIKAIHEQGDSTWRGDGVDLVEERQFTKKMADVIDKYKDSEGVASVIGDTPTSQVALSLFRGEDKYSAISKPPISDEIGEKWQEFNKGGREARIEGQMKEVFQDAIDRAAKGESTTIDTLVFYTVDFGKETERKSDVGTEFKKYVEEQGATCPTLVTLAHCDVSKMMEHMEARNSGPDAGERRTTFRPFDEYGEYYKVTNSQDPKAVGTFTVDELTKADRYDGPEGKKAALLETLGVPEGTPSDQSLSVRVRDEITHDKIYQTDPIDKGGMTSKDITTEIAKDINQTISQLSERQQESKKHNSVMEELDRELGIGSVKDHFLEEARKIGQEMQKAGIEERLGKADEGNVTSPSVSDPGRGNDSNGPAI